MLALAVVNPPKPESKNRNKIVGTNDKRVIWGFNRIDRYFGDEMKYVNPKIVTKMVSEVVKYFESTIGQYDPCYNIKFENSCVLFDDIFREYCDYIENDWGGIAELKAERIENLHPDGFIFYGFLEKFRFQLKYDSACKVAANDGYLPL